MVPYFRYFAPILILFGIILRLREYLSNRTFTWDEAAVAISIIDKPFLELGNLFYYQHHPFLFLSAVKFLTLTINTSEFSFRLIPLFSGILSIIFFRKLSRKFFGKNFTLIALAMFVFMTPLINYSAILREYTTDVLLNIATYILLINYVLRGKIDLKAIFIMSVFGALSVWFSNPVFFLLFSSGLILEVYFLAKRKYDSFLRFGIICLFWVASMVINYFLISKNILRDEVILNDFAKNFLPFPPQSLSDLQVGLQAFLSIFNFQIGNYYLPALMIFFIGMYAFFFKSKLLLALLITPLLLAFLLACFHLYPLTGRHLLYTAPAIILIITKGVEYTFVVSKKHKYFFQVARLFFIVIFTVEFLGFLNAQAISGIEEQGKLKDLMYSLNRMRQPGDWIYLYNSTSAPYKYYAPRYGLADVPYVEGTYRTIQYEKYLEDFKPLLGKKRVWVLFTHNYSWETIDEHAYITGYLNKIGKETDLYIGDDYSVLYLYDLSK